MNSSFTLSLFSVCFFREKLVEKSSMNISSLSNKTTGPDLNSKSDYSYDINLDSDSTQANIIKYIGKNKKVLEFGAGRGAITRALIDANSCEVHVVENDRESLQVLRQITRNVYDIDLNTRNACDELMPIGPFDVLLFADVLEHLFDPWLLIKSSCKLLNENGFIVVSLPHAGHASIIACLLNNDFAYQDKGLLDKTHIRFFGLVNIEQLHTSAGLEIVDSKFTICDPGSSELSSYWEIIPDNIKTSIFFNPYAHIYQVVTKSKPGNVIGNEKFLLKAAPQFKFISSPDQSSTIISKIFANIVSNFFRK
jgi:2-polyprenyl-3-methyl-5-hydroxy-6-metoxy-1,4-benzoquinol methylase